MNGKVKIKNMGIRKHIQLNFIQVRKHSEALQKLVKSGENVQKLKSHIIKVQEIDNL